MSQGHCPVAFSSPLLTIVFLISFEAGNTACGFQLVDLGFTGELCMSRALDPSVCMFLEIFHYFLFAAAYKCSGTSKWEVQTSQM